MRLLVSIFISLFSVSCAYELGYKSKNLPGEHTVIKIPMFTNETKIVGAEIYFTNELKRQFYRSKIANISDNAPVKIIGKIRRIYIDQDARGSKEDFPNLPANTVITTSYNMTIDVKIQMIRKSDKKIIWQSEFSDFLLYSGAQLKLEGVNSSNTIYNQSAVKTNIQKLANIMMSEAHNRLTENF